MYKLGYNLSQLYFSLPRVRGKVKLYGVKVMKQDTRYKIQDILFQARGP